MRTEIGVPGPDGFEVAVQVNPRTAGRQLSVDLPGEVMRAGRLHFVRLLPLVAVVLPAGGGKPARGGLFSFAEAGSEATAEALTAFDKIGPRKVPSRVG